MEAMKNVITEKTESKRKKTGVKSIRFTEEELARLDAIFQVGRKRQKYANETDIIKELIGLTPLVALTESDVRNFRSKRNAND